MQHLKEVYTRKLAGKNPDTEITSPRVKAIKPNARTVQQKKKAEPTFEETPNSITINWRNIQDCSLRVQKSTIRKVVKLAVEKHKKTVAIDDIAIYNPYDVNSAAKVLNAKKEVVSAVGKSAKSLSQVNLINRLFLDSGKFGVRFYLGDEHPADYTFRPNER